MSLWQDFLTNDARVIHKWKHYFPVYERHLSRYINTDVVLIEIGCGRGGSLQMWKRFLGPHARIIGIDIDPACAEYAEDQITVRIGSQTDPAFLTSVLNELGNPDIILDDGSHVMNDVLASFRMLYPHVMRNGIYMVEDLLTAYWPEYGGGLKRQGTFIEHCKDLIDEMNADHTRGALQPTPFSQSTLSMHIYNSMVVFEKGRHTTKLALKTGGIKDRPIE